MVTFLRQVIELKASGSLFTPGDDVSSALLERLLVESNEIVYEIIFMLQSIIQI